jgi:hypothetical protein
MIRKFGNVQGIAEQALGIDSGAGVNTADATATAAQILAPQTAYGATGSKLTGAMPENGAVNITPSASSQPIPAGHTSGGNVAAVVVPVANVLAGTTIAGQAGTMVNNGAGNTVTPSTANQTRAAGFWSSLITILGDANLLAQNILAGITIFGITGNLIKALGSATVGDVASGATFSNASGSNLTGTGANVKRWAKVTGNTNGVISGLAFTPAYVFGFQASSDTNNGFSLLGATKVAEMWSGTNGNAVFQQQVISITPADAKGSDYGAYTPTWTASGVTLVSILGATNMTYYVFE